MKKLAILEIRTIHLISDDRGSELFARSLQSIFTVYGKNWDCRAIDDLEEWELYKLLSEVPNLILAIRGYHNTIEFIETYASERCSIILWQFLQPIARSCDDLIFQLQHLTELEFVKVRYLISYEYPPELWDRVLGIKLLSNLICPKCGHILSAEAAIRQIRPETAQMLGELTIVPNLILTDLPAFDSFGRPSNSLIGAEVNQSVLDKIAGLFDAIFSHIPAYLLI